MKVYMLKENMKRMAERGIREAFDKAFDGPGHFFPNGIIETISWTQYTPYFNDGEPCTFSVHSDWYYAIEVNGIKYDDVEDCVKIVEEYYESLQEILDGIDESVLQFLGEGRVTLYRDGTLEVEEIDHE